MRIIFIIPVIFLQSACASMFGGTSQEVQINTSPQGADCTVSREGQVLGHVNPTPGSIFVEKSRKDLQIKCVKAEFVETEGMSDSGVEPWVFMNILFGGLIGLGIDHATGGVNEYQSPVLITLLPVEPSTTIQEVPPSIEPSQQPAVSPTS